MKEYARRVLGFSSRAFTKQKYIEKGIVLNGKACLSTSHLKVGDTLTFLLPEENLVYPPVDLPISILWEDEDYLAVEKGAGMPVHPSPGHDADSLLHAVAYYCQSKGEGYAFRPLYRLDKDTSGILLVGKNRLAVSSARVEKQYYAVCEGKLSGSGVIDLPIGLAPGSKILRQAGHGERAVTHWRALAEEEGHTLLALRLETGRTHQIRAHLSFLGHPLAGDDLYGGSRRLIGRQALHCGRAVLTCGPLGLASKQLSSELPCDIREAFPWLPPILTYEKEELFCRRV